MSNKVKEWAALIFFGLSFLLTFHFTGVLHVRNWKPSLSFNEGCRCSYCLDNHSEKYNTVASTRQRQMIS